MDLLRLPPRVCASLHCFTPSLYILGPALEPDWDQTTQIHSVAYLPVAVYLVELVTLICSWDVPGLQAGLLVNLVSTCKKWSAYID